MAYADAKVTPEERIRAATSVIAIHALLGFGIVVGLTVTGVIAPPVPNPTSTFATPRPTEPPPPPPPTDPVEQQQQNQRPQSTPKAPESPFEFTRPSDSVDVFDGGMTDPTPFGGDIDVPDLGPVGPKPSPSPAFTATGAVPRNGPAGWITNDDYSDRDLRRGNEGTASYRLVIGSDGRVDACEITRSTGHSTLDNATCRLIRQRARFDAAMNDRGQKVVGTYSGTVAWRIPE